MVRRFLLIALLASNICACAIADGTKGVEEAALDEAFLQKFEGEWRMEGRAKPYPGGDWYTTGSTMSAELRLKDQAIVRFIDAPAINMEALDVIGFNPKTKAYTYTYWSSNFNAPIVMVGERTGAEEITVRSKEYDTRTVIRFLSDDKMVAEDFDKDKDGNEYLSREVFHYRTTE